MSTKPGELQPSLAVILITFAGCGADGAGGLDSTPQRFDGTESHEIEQEDVDAAAGASDAVRDYCADSVSEAQRLGCESHITDDEVLTQPAWRSRRYLLDGGYVAGPARPRKPAPTNRCRSSRKAALTGDRAGVCRWQPQAQRGGHATSSFPGVELHGTEQVRCSSARSAPLLGAALPAQEPPDAVAWPGA